MDGTGRVGRSVLGIDVFKWTAYKGCKATPPLNNLPYIPPLITEHGIEFSPLLITC